MATVAAPAAAAAAAAFNAPPAPNAPLPAVPEVPEIAESRKRKFGDEVEEEEEELRREGGQEETSNNDKLLDISNTATTASASSASSKSAISPKQNSKRRALSRVVNECKGTVAASPKVIAKRMGKFSRSVSTKSLLNRRQRSSKRKTARGYFGSPRRSNSTTSLWCETLGDNKEAVLNKLSTRDQRRQEAIFELTRGEEQYVKDLRNLIAVFKDPMRKMQLLTPDEEARIFSNISALLDIHVTLSEQFSSARGVDGIDDVGTLLNAFLPKTELYATYCSNQALAKLTLEHKMRECPRFTEYLDNARDMKLSRSLDIWSFLDAPRRRLQRYPLLLSTVLKHTDAEHADYTRLEAAIKTCHVVLQKIDRVVEEDSTSRVASIQSSLEFSHSWQKVDLVADGKPLVLEASASLRDGRTLQLYLFQHLLVMTKDSKKTPGARAVMGRPMRLESIELEEVPSDETDTAVKLRNCDQTSGYSSMMGTVKDSMRSSFKRQSSVKGKAYSVVFSSTDAKAAFVSQLTKLKEAIPVYL